LDCGPEMVRAKGEKLNKMDTNLNDTTSPNALMGVFEWGGVKIDMDAIPNETFVGLARQGIIHKLGNEVAASLVKVKEKQEKEHEGEADWEFDEDAAKIELREGMVKKILDGTVGLRIGGPRGSTIENIAWELASKEAEAKLAPKGYWPKADRKAGIKAEDAKIEFVGRMMTRENLVDMVYNKYAARFLEKAAVEHAARMEKAKLAKANAVKPIASVAQTAEEALADLI
jgi:hypothetical protein